MIGILFFIIIGIVAYVLIQKSKSKAILNRDQNIINAMKSKNNSTHFEITEESLIRLASRLGGRISVKDVITQTTLSEEKAKEKLEHLLQTGKCEIKLDEVEATGVIYYYFS